MLHIVLLAFFLGLFVCMQNSCHLFSNNLTVLTGGGVQVNLQVVMNFCHLYEQFWTVAVYLICLKKMDPDILRYFVRQCNTTAAQTLTADSIVWDLADTPWSVFWKRLPCLPLELFSLCLSVWTCQSVKILLTNLTSSSLPPIPCLSWHHKHQVSKADSSKWALV